MTTLFKSRADDRLVELDKIVDRTAYFFPAGGGFMLTCPEKAFFESFDAVTKPMPLRKFRFGGEWSDEKFVGYTDGTRWNGWAAPYVTRAVADEVLKAQEDLLFGLPPDEVNRLRWEGDTLMLYDAQEKEESPVTPVATETEDGELMLYPISFGWCWEFYGWLSDEPPQT